MILTTGVSIGQDAAAQRRFVRDLEAEGAVGIAVELGLAWDRELPRPLVDEADRRTTITNKFSSANANQQAVSGYRAGQERKTTRRISKRVGADVLGRL